MQWAIAHVVNADRLLSRFNFSDCERFSCRFLSTRSNGSYFTFWHWLLAQCLLCVRARSLTPAIPTFIIMYDIHGRERHYLSCLFTFHSKSIHKSETMPESRLYGATRVFHSHCRLFCAPHGFFMNSA